MIDMQTLHISQYWIFDVKHSTIYKPLRNHFTTGYGMQAE